MTKICPKCGSKKSLLEFSKKKSCKDGYQSWCKKCVTKYGKKYTRKNKNKQQKYIRKWALENKYNMTLKEYDELFEKQKGVCAVCGGINNNGYRLYVDHNHQTEKVRGLLCQRCNSFIGIAGDGVKLLKKAVQYLNKQN